MNSKRLHLLLVGLIVLLFAGLVGGAYMLNGLLTKKGNDLTGLKAQAQALQQSEADLAVAKKQIAQYADLEKVTKAVVPEDKSQAEATREIVNIASASGVQLTTITFPPSTLGTSAVRPGAPVSASPAPSAAASANSKTAALSQLLPVKGMSGVYQLTITIGNDSNHEATYSNLVNFLAGLEHNRRTAQVSTLNITPDAKNPRMLTFTISLNEYIKP